MGGEIGAESAPGAGSRFWFTITAAVDDRIRAIPALSDAAFDRVRLLAVDDNAVNRRVLEELVNGWGLKATIVSCAREAMEMLERSVRERDAYGAILMDFQMPGEDGAALTRRIQSDSRFASIPVIMLSSVDPLHMGPMTGGARFAAQLHKPVRPSQLMDVLARVLLDEAAKSLTRATQALQRPAAPVNPENPNGRIKVLLADDNTVNQLVIKNMIGSETYEIILADNGEAAVKLFIEKAPALVLMDLSMPVMDGLEATRRIRALEAERGLPHTPIVAATAHVLEQDRERCRLAGMDDFLSKPVRKPKLDDILRRWTSAPPETAAKSA
jgi:CheY-like chemotaxis protein